MSACINSFEISSSFSSQPLSSLMSISSPSLSSSGYITGISAKAAVSTLPGSATSSRSPFIFDLNFMSRFIIFHLICCTLFFVGQFPLFMIHFGKYCMCFSYREHREASQLPLWLSVCALIADVQRPITQTDFVGSAVISY